MSRRLFVSELADINWLSTKFVLRAQGYKTFFRLNSAENEICSAYQIKYQEFKPFYLHSRAEPEIFPANKY